MDRRTFAALAAGSGLLAAAGALLPKAALAQSLRLTGAGASFPFPLYSTWFQAYSQATSGIEIDYQSTGSGAGVKSFISRTVDFAASDSAMTDEQIGQVDGGVVILPMTAGEIVLAYNLPGVTELKLPREVYPLIFLGEVTSWNDPRIAAANPGVTLPDTHDHRGAALRRQRHHLRVHEPPRGDQREVQGHRQCWHQPAVARREQPGRGAAQ